MNSNKSSREKLKIFKNYPKSAKHAFFATIPSRIQVTKTSHETPETKFLKNLSKYFLRLEVQPARKSQREPQKLLSKLATEASTHKQAAKLSCEKTKNPEFSKIFQVFFMTGALTRQ